MNFDELYRSVKEKFCSHPEIILPCENLTVQIVDKADSFSHAFYLIWQNHQCILDQYHCDDYDVYITGTQDEIEKMFTEHQYLMQDQQQLSIEGSFNDVRMFQNLLSFITSENTYTIQKELLSDLLAEQKTMRDDLDVVMQTLHLMLANSMISLPERSMKSLDTKELKEMLLDKSNDIINTVKNQMIVGKKVKLDPTCKYCYDSYYVDCLKNLSKVIYNASSYVYTVKCIKDKKVLLYTKNDYGQEFRFWVNENMIIPCDNE